MRTRGSVYFEVPQFDIEKPLEFFKQAALTGDLSEDTFAENCDVPNVQEVVNYVARSSNDHARNTLLGLITGESLRVSHLYSPEAGESVSILDSYGKTQTVVEPPEAIRNRSNPSFIQAKFSNIYK